MKPETQEEFLADPMLYVNDDLQDYPATWLREAWLTNNIFANEIYSDLSRSISKTGTLRQAIGALKVLARILTDDELLQLFYHLRAVKIRQEVEWRKGFESAFPQIADLLPPLE